MKRIKITVDLTKLTNIDDKKLLEQFLVRRRYTIYSADANSEVFVLDLKGRFENADDALIIRSSLSRFGGLVQNGSITVVTEEI